MTEATTTPAATPQPGPAPTDTAPAPTSTPAPTSFVDSIQDAGLKAWATNKGWKDTESALRSAHQLEKMVGAPADEVLRLPKNADEKTIKAVFSKLGKPADPAEYKFFVPEGQQPDTEFQDWARGAFHEADLTAAQAAKLSEKHETDRLAKLEAAQTKYNADVEAGNRELQRELGAGYERKLAMAKNAARELGFTKEMLDGMEAQVGYKETMKFMVGLTDKLGEDNFITGEMKTSGFHSRMTPEQAKDAWLKMTLDPETTKALLDKDHPAHKEMLTRKGKLFELMHPGQ